MYKLHLFYLYAFLLVFRSILNIICVLFIRILYILIFVLLIHCLGYSMNTILIAGGAAAGGLLLTVSIIIISIYYCQRSRNRSISRYRNPDSNFDNYVEVGIIIEAIDVIPEITLNRPFYHLEPLENGVERIVKSEMPFYNSIATTPETTACTTEPPPYYISSESST